MLESFKYNKKTEEYIRVKKVICPKDRTIFDFTIQPPNDKSKVINSLFLTILKAEIERCPSINNVITNVEFELVETLF